MSFQGQGDCQTHLFSYRHDGAEWVLEIKARDAEDAHQRLGKLAFATYDGVLVAKLAVPYGSVRLLTEARRVVLGLYHFLAGGAIRG